MNLWIFHYHLHPGGVRKVIRSQIDSLKKQYPSLHIGIITGYCPDIFTFQKDGITVRVNAALNYLADEDYSRQSINEWYASVKNWIQEIVDPEDIVHVHNLNLGKNPLVTYVFYKLAHEGYYILNHCHDFAEDRPNNMAFLRKIINTYFHSNDQEVLYPDCSNYMYGVLNSSDKIRLIQYGISPNRIYFIPNPVHSPGEIPSTTKQEAHNYITGTLSLDPSKPLITYPVRVIRRKNVGEFILLSILFAEQFHWVITQPPKNPEEIAYYEVWKEFCIRHDIPVYYEVGNKVDFPTLIYASAYCFTTSYREGFGMAFLEPWLMNTPVAGRNIDYVTRDFKEAGLQLPLLYDKLNVTTDAGQQDFADLSEEEQRKVIKQVLCNQNIKETIKKAHPILQQFTKGVSSQLIEDNKQTIIQNYSLSKFGERLYGIYKNLIGAD